VFSELSYKHSIPGFTVVSAIYAIMNCTTVPCCGLGVFQRVSILVLVEVRILEKVLTLPIPIHIFKKYCSSLAILKAVLAVLIIAKKYCNINNSACQ